MLLTPIPCKFLMNAFESLKQASRQINANWQFAFPPICFHYLFISFAMRYACKQHYIFNHSVWILQKEWRTVLFWNHFWGWKNNNHTGKVFFETRSNLWLCNLCIMFLCFVYWVIILTVNGCLYGSYDNPVYCLAENMNIFAKWQQFFRWTLV